jgi:acyl carrier protein
MKIEDKLLALVKKYSKINKDDIKSATKISDLKFDSLDFLEFQMAVDDEFGIEISIDDFLECKNINDVIQLVEKYIVYK